MVNSHGAERVSGVAETAARLAAVCVCARWAHAHAHTLTLRYNELTKQVTPHLLTSLTNKALYHLY